MKLIIFTMEKTIVLTKTFVVFEQQYLYNFDFLWIKLWYYAENYGTLPKTMEL